MAAVPVGPEFRNAEPFNVPVVTEPSQIAPMTTGVLMAPGVQLLFTSAPDPVNPFCCMIHLGVDKAEFDPLCVRSPKIKVPLAPSPLPFAIKVAALPAPAW